MLFLLGPSCSGQSAGPQAGPGVVGVAAGFEPDALSSAGVSARLLSITQSGWGPGFSLTLACLARAMSGSLGQFGTAGCALARGGGKSRVGGTTSGERSLYWMAPCPARPTTSSILS